MSANEYSSVKHRSLNDSDVFAMANPGAGSDNRPKPQMLFVKRSMDICLSFFALIALLPLLLGVAALIRLESRGPILFQQVRWGRNGSKIKIYKFRSMYHHLCDDTGVKQTVSSDVRITEVGKIIRRLNIDELPQLYNVLKGDMSLVGPRCHAIGMLAAGVPYEDLVPNYHKRHRMRPGITGVAQMRGLRGPTDRPSKARARVACDLYYVDNFSIALDVRVMLETVRSQFFRGAGF